MRNPTYLGDGLYASFDGYQICLMANSHTHPTDKVYLDPGTLESFERYVRDLRAAQARARAAMEKGENDANP